MMQKRLKVEVSVHTPPGISSACGTTLAADQRGFLETVNLSDQVHGPRMLVDTTSSRGECNFDDGIWHDSDGTGRRWQDDLLRRANLSPQEQSSLMLCMCWTKLPTRP